MQQNVPAASNMDALCQLAQRYGVATSFWNWYGHSEQVSADTLLRVLQALGVPVSTESHVADVEAALREAADAQWRRTLPPTIVATEGTSKAFSVHVPHGSDVRVTWHVESGESGECAQLDHWVDPRDVDGHLIGRATFETPAHVQPGWHTVTAQLADGRTETTTLLVAPRRLNPEMFAGGRRYWGVAAQLYSTRSSASWGIGDAADLATVASLCAAEGADFILINPTHASTPVTPQENSPYLPVSRRWTHPIYIRPELIDEYATLTSEQKDAIEQLRQQATSHADATADSALIDRNRVWQAKRAALDIVHSAPRTQAREADLRSFITEGGKALADFALWCALVEAYGSDCLPAELASPQSADARRAAAELADRVEFWQWCQWIVAAQMRAAHDGAKRAGMQIGVIADLAVGVHSKGSETWADANVFASGMTVGAPPDMYSQLGQNWSEPPWSPIALAAAGYAPLRDMVRSALANAGALRIDHILGLFRLWWIPEGGTPADGTYVAYDHEAMLGTILLEAQRAGAIVIGEDLGTLEPWVRDHLRERSVLGTAVLWFEKDEADWPTHAHAYRAECLAAVGTHDLPPTAGYLRGVHTTLRHELGLLIEDVEVVRQRDAVEVERMVTRLREYGLVTSEDPSEAELIEAMHAYIARTPAQLVAVSLVDAVGEQRPQNLPGTYLEYPNWCVPLGDADGCEILIDNLGANPRLRALFEVMRNQMGSLPR